MPMTQRLAEILAEMVVASLDAKERRARVERCPGCPYGTETVGSSGNPSSPIAIVGEARGHTELKLGRPFVGPAGQTLRRAIEEAGLTELDHRGGVGPSGWSASRDLGITTQRPAVEEFATVGPPPTGIEGVRFRHRSNPMRANLRHIEIAALEVIAAWPAYVEGDWGRRAAGHY